MFKKIFYIVLIGFIALVFYMLISVLCVGKVTKKDTLNVNNSMPQTIIIDLENNNSIDCEEYIKGALYQEFEDIKPNEEVLKALSIIIRTHIYKVRENVNKDMITKTECGYEYNKNYTQEYSKIVDSTKSNVILYNTQLIDAFYCMCSGGVTKDGVENLKSEEYGYLQSVEVKEDCEAQGYLTLVYYKKDELRELIKDRFDIDLGEDYTSDMIDMSNMCSSGYVKNIKINNYIIDSEEFAKAVGLMSTCIYIEEFNGGIRMISKGIGHGYGLSIVGADAMADKGKNYEEILHYFYKDIIISEQ